MHVTVFMIPGTSSRVCQHSFICFCGGQHKVVSPERPWNEEEEEKNCLLKPKLRFELGRFFFFLPDDDDDDDDDDNCAMGHVMK